MYQTYTKDSILNILEISELNNTRRSQQLSCLWLLGVLTYARKTTLCKISLAHSWLSPLIKNFHSTGRNAVWNSDFD